MKLSYRIYLLIYPWWRVLTKGLHFERRPYQATIPGLMPPPKPWYWALTYEILKTILILIASIAVGIMGVVIVHYTGYEDYFMPAQYR
ncbi:MAG: hypothetical protein B7Y56_10800 [Gallionellales bacterium 35-53-114]|jgi:hypothetical protein|nr:MAG: hypothetical protein B7Y56_10800 [Gallionellales bacterium 35-53-114]OYZ64889.1 MAG: hypothetical protein B7Y04_03800 [Gallionellales bacterium 24-53-125]OZB07573.1 MAG: hypothetical protein B7X61_13215 [Gallionellales bacterium 39-52-133]HQS58747.1 hypothetical protein [Gallionellaceae bacterium]HQS75087.1 hypothetical protein [Gallionellaceae bacterium]